MINYYKTKYKVICLISFFFLINTTDAMALHPATHRAINESIAETTSLDDYLKNQLGVKEGIKEKYYERQIFKWIGYGGEQEDSMGVRSFNHFHNPLTNTGLSQSYSALIWATLPVGGQGFAPISSWYDVRDYYYRAMTVSDKTSRNDWFARTFQGVGQIMHLVEDMSVPAHTRKDIHPPPFWNDPYEKWFHNPNANPKARNISEYGIYAGYTPINAELFLIPQLFDSGKYVGTNPGDTMLSTIGLSEFTNANFLSSDTIFRNFTYPDWGNLQPYEEDMDSRGLAIYQRKTGPLPVEHFVREKIYYDLLPANEAFRGLRLDDNVHSDYAQYLIPRAIGYAAEALKYFFRGKLEAEIGDGKIKIKNTSKETLSDGTFELYYDNAEGVRTLVASAQANTLAPGSEQEIPISAPQDAASFMLVFKGKLGNESGAVIGKYIPAELVVVTIGLRYWNTEYPYDAPGEFYPKRSVFVWSPAENWLVRALCDSGSGDFLAWHSAAQRADQSRLFSKRTLCGTTAVPGNIPQPSGCLELNLGTQDTSYGEIAATKVGEWGGGAMDLYDWVIDLGYDIKAYGDPKVETYESITYPVSASYTVLLPESPVPAIGFRTRKTLEKKGRFTDIASNGINVPYTGIKGSSHTTTKETFYGPLGEFGFFDGFEDITGDGILLEGPHSIKTYYIPGSMTGVVGRYKWFDYALAGTYSSKVIADVSVVQLIGMTTTRIALDWVYNHPESITNTLDDTRTIFVQAQALHVPQGTTGHDWISKGRNSALESHIKEAIRMAYDLNGIPGDEIRTVSIDISIINN